MRLLLDSNALIWWRSGSRRLPRRVAQEIRDPKNDVIVSIVSLWEITIKRALRKLDFLEDFEHLLADEEFELLAISYAHLRSLESLALHHRDPFDRLLIAQATAEGIPIATGDRRFRTYGVQVVW